MTPMKGTIAGPVTANELAGSFFFSVCDGWMPDAVCNPSDNSGANVHSCFADSSKTMQADFGSELEFVSAGDSSHGNDVSFLLNFHDGQTCFIDPEKTLETTILFRCSPNAGVGHPQFLSFNPSTCTATFTWASQYGCRSCTSDDYEEVVSSCKNGLQRTELRKVGRCNGEDNILTDEAECTDIAVPIGIIAGAVGIILVMIGVIIFVVYKNRKITIKYTKLLADQSAELEAMADEDDDRVMSKKLATISQDDDEDQKDRDGSESGDEPREEEDGDEDDDDGQGVGHIRK